MAQGDVRAMWVWNTRELLFNEPGRAELFAFCKEKDVTEIFAQVIGRYSGEGKNTTYRFGYRDELKTFIEEAARAGVRVHALDGNPTFALKPNHPKVLALVDEVIDFNNASSEEGRFFGIHLDNEPYLLPLYHTQGREQLLREFLELNQQCVERIRMRQSPVVYGVDIPFWFEEPDEDGRIPGLVEVEGEKKGASLHLIDIVDNIGIMDYRTFSEGPDGLIRHAEDELAYASKVGKKVYIGIETSRETPTDVWFMADLDEEKFEQGFGPSGEGMGNDYLFKGYRLHILKEDGRVHVGLATKKDLGPDRDPKLGRLLYSIGEQYGTPLASDKREEARAIADDAGFALSGNAEYVDFKPAVLENEAGRLFPAFKTRYHMLDKITFEGMGERAMEKVLSEVHEAFKAQSAFYGYAIHYYKTYKELVKSKK